MYSKYRITRTAATVAALMGFEKPACAEDANELVVENARRALPAGTENVLTHLGTGRGLMVLPDKILRVSVNIPKEWHSY